MVVSTMVMRVMLVMLARLVTLVTLVGGGENGDGGDGGDTECDNVGGNDGGGPSACSLCLGRSK